MRKKQIIIIALLCLIITSVTAIFLLRNNKTKAYDKQTYETKEVGESKHIRKDYETYETSLFYPETKYKTLNKEIKNYINKKPNFKAKEKFIYYMDYETTKTYDQYTTVKFYTTIFNKDEKPLVTTIHTINYDQKNDTILGIQDVLRKDYENMIKTQLHKNNKKEDINAMRDFTLDKKGITLYFNQENKDTLFLEYEQVKPYVKLKNKKIASLYQGDITKTKEQVIDPNKPMIALTLDDGPNPINTPRIMNALEKYNANATFFVLGLQVAKFPEIVKDMDKRGFEVASHTYHHKNLATLNDKEAYDEIMNTQDLIYETIGKDPTQMRPPFGSIPKLDMQNFHLNIALWNIDTLDWKSKDPSAIKTNVLNNVKDGAIILMHDIYDTSAQSIEELIPLLQQRGFQIVDLSTLIKYRYS